METFDPDRGAGRVCRAWKREQDKRKREGEP